MLKIVNLASYNQNFNPSGWPCTDPTKKLAATVVILKIYFRHRLLNYGERLTFDLFTARLNLYPHAFV